MPNTGLEYPSIANTLNTIFEYINQDGKESEDFLLNPSPNHIFLPMIDLGITFLGWDVRLIFTALAEDGDQYDLMMEAWDEYLNNKKEA